MSKKEEINDSEESEENNGEPHPEYKVLAKNSFYSFLNTWGFLIFSIVNAFFMSKLLNPDTWQIFILAYSIIGISSLIIGFLPPGLENATEYYVSRFYSLEDFGSLKNFVINAFLSRILFLIPVFGLSLLGFSLLSNFLSGYLQGHSIIIFILSPLIFIISLNSLSNSMNKSFNNYKLIVITLLSQQLLNIAILTSLFILFRHVTVEVISIANIITYIPPFLINIIINLRRILKLNKTKYSVKSIKNNILDTIKYGGYTKSGMSLSQFWMEGQLLSIGAFEPLGLVTGYKIGQTLVDVPRQATIALSSPLIISFSRLIALEEKEKIHNIYNIVLKYNIFLLLFLFGLIFFGTDIYIYLVLGPGYLVYSSMIKILILSYSFFVFFFPLEALLLAEKKVKYIPLIRGVELIVNMPVFLTILIFFGLMQAVIGLLISSVVINLIYILITIKIGKINLNFREILLQFVAFSASVGISLLLDILFLSNINRYLLESINLGIISNFNIFTFSIFIFTYLASNILLRIFTHEDIETFQSFLNKNSTIHRLANKFLILLKKIIKEKKE